MVVSWVLIEGQGVSEGSLTGGVSLMNAKQSVVGSTYEFGVILHVAADSLADLNNALGVLSQVPGVTGVLTLAIRTTPR
jgi:copper homeostasis protein CutC